MRQYISVHDKLPSLWPIPLKHDKMAQGPLPATLPFLRISALFKPSLVTSGPGVISQSPIHQEKGAVMCRLRSILLRMLTTEHTAGADGWK